MPDTMPRVRAGQCATDRPELWRSIATRSGLADHPPADHAPQPTAPLYDELPDQAEEDAPRWFYALLIFAWGVLVGVVLRTAL